MKTRGYENITRRFLAIVAFLGAVYPNRVTAAQIEQYLSKKNIDDRHIRTIQRIMISLEQAGIVDCITETGHRKTLFWGMTEDGYKFIRLEKKDLPNGNH